MRCIYLWTRDLHLYAGLALSPVVLVFAASVLVLNHPATDKAPRPTAGPAAAVHIPPGIEKLEGMERALAAQQILEQLGVRGEIGWISYDAKRGTLAVPVSRPGWEGTVRVSIPQASATVEWSNWSFANAVNWFHKTPGPHLAKTRGNWRAVRLWRPAADATVYGLLFLTATGLYLWIVLRAERKAGLLALGLGALSFIGTVYALL